MGDNVLILNEDEFRRITMTSDAKLVYKFLRDKKYYNMLMRIFSDRLSYFCVKCEDNGEISTFNKRSIIKIIKVYYDRLNNDDKRRVQRLRKLVSFEALKVQLPMKVFVRVFRFLSNQHISEVLHYSLCVSKKHFHTN